MFDHDRGSALHEASDEDLERELLFRKELKGAVLTTKDCASYEKVPKFKEVRVRYPTSGVVVYHHSDKLEEEKTRFDCYKEGQKAGMDDMSDAQNPYPEDFPVQRKAWQDGWASVQALVNKVRSRGHSGR